MTLPWKPSEALPNRVPPRECSAMADNRFLPHWQREAELGREKLDAAYAERSAVVLAFAHMAELMGWTVGKVTDPSEPDWPVLMIDTPAGQVSWHFKADAMPQTMPDYPGRWDGHTTPEKYARLERLVGMGWGEGRASTRE